jgi:hypothetical protein
MMNARFVRYSKKVSRLLRKMEQAMEKERNAKELRQGLHAALAWPALSLAHSKLVRPLLGVCMMVML